MSEQSAENDAAERPTRRAHPKNTKRWCRGVVGREHVTEVVIPANAIRRECSPRDDARWGRYTWEVGCYHVEQCVNCGKHVRSFLGKGECPTRVIPPAEPTADTLEGEGR